MTPFATTTELLDHQVQAVAKVGPTRIGALFMEQGTGKSRTAIELAKCRAGKIDRVVWFCPVSLMATVYGEIRKHTDVAVTRIYRFDERTRIDRVPSIAEWIIIGIESMSASPRLIQAAQAVIGDQTMVILDESSYCKGHAAWRTRRITAFSEKARYRLAMTGTPLSQGVVDLYAQLRFLSPAILGYTSFYTFAANHLEYSEQYPGMIVRAHNTEWLAAKMAPYVYQVTKDECLTLPPKAYAATQYCELTWQQRRAYDATKWEFFDRMERYDIWPRTALFQLFTELQRIVSGYERLPQRRTTVLLDVLAAWDRPKTIIWAKYHYDIEQIREALARVYGGEAVVELSGRLTPRERERVIDRWRRDVPFLVATQGVGGHGFTFNEAEAVIFYTNGFKYSERQQAEDRSHRFGQTHTVRYVDIVASQTIDERIATALRDKESVVDAFQRDIDRVKTDQRKEVLQAL